MKTSVYLTFVILLTGTQLLAQNLAQPSFRAGSWQVGLHDGYTRGYLFGHRNTLQFQAGYYVINKLSVGVGATWAREGNSDFGFKELTIGPSVRYHFTTTRFSPFIDVSYQVGRRSAIAGTLTDYQSVGIQTTQLSPGVSFRVIPALRVELLYNVQWVHATSWTSSIIQPHLGITYLVGKK